MVAVRILRPKFVECTTLQGKCQAARQDVALTEESGTLPRVIAEPPELPSDCGLIGRYCHSGRRGVASGRGPGAAVRASKRFPNSDGSCISRD